MAWSWLFSLGLWPPGAVAGCGRGAVLHADVLPVDADAKRLRLHTTVWNGEEAVLTGEYLFLHVDQDGGRVTPFPEDRAEAIAEVGQTILVRHPEHGLAARAMVTEVQTRREPRTGEASATYRLEVPL